MKDKGYEKENLNNPGDKREPEDRIQVRNVYV